ncbi:MAG: dUTP diphosphatase [Candidatus Pacebacteria bacterium]|nr:dUTP diphosphatase [Candidatus Paceibacterota bacterium]
MIQIKVKKLHEMAELPKFAHETDAGADLTAVRIERNGDVLTYYLGIAVEIPVGYCMEIAPRSSISKYDLELCNSIGVVDADYRGEIMLKFRLTTSSASYKIYKIGDKVGQAIIRKLVPTEYVEVIELTNTVRGTGGFGSTSI